MNPEGQIEAVSAWLSAVLEEDEGGKADGSQAAEAETKAAADADEPNLEVKPDLRAAETAAGPRHAPTVAAQPLRTFEPATLPSGDPVQFYEFRSSRQLADHLRLAIDAEGPVMDAVLFRRVARAWGLERTGHRIVERLRRLMPPDIRQTTDRAGTFYWPQGCEPATWIDCRVATTTESSRRHVDEVSIEEISALLLHVLRYSGASPRADAARSVCRLLGMARTPAESEARVGMAIDRLLAMKAVYEVDGTVRLPP
ncbi:MAG TPA: hypothetical protein DHV08_12055 [Rhodocyclaceae bacterium]|nr:hypothetical protein [Rhodocyclaceae bacterium]